MSTRVFAIVMAAALTATSFNIPVFAEEPLVIEDYVEVPVVEVEEIEIKNEEEPSEDFYISDVVEEFTTEEDGSDMSVSEDGVITVDVEENVGTISGDKVEGVDYYFTPDEYITAGVEQKGQTCMAYAHCAAFETAMIKAGITDNTINLSEHYMVDYFSYEHIYENNFSIDALNGIAEETVEDNSWNGEETFNTLAKRPQAAVVTEVHRVWDPTHDGYDGFASYISDTNIEKIKKALKEYGSLVIENQMNGGHALQIIGWENNHEYHTSKGNEYYDSWKFKDSAYSGSQIFQFYPYNRQKTKNITGYKVEAPGRFDNQYSPYGWRDDEDHSNYNVINKNPSHCQETLNAIGVSNMSDDEEATTIRIYKETGCPEELGDDPLLATVDVTMIRGYKKVDISPVNLNYNDRLYATAEKNGKITIRRNVSSYFTKNTEIPSDNVILLNTAEINFNNPYMTSVQISAETDTADTLSYESLNSSVATVDADGNVSPAALGTTYIKVSNACDEKYVKVDVKVVDFTKADIKVADTTYGDENPAPVVKWNGQTLDSSHYKCVYQNNINAGKASVTITGIAGDYGTEGYNGTRTIEYTIHPKSLSADSIIQNTTALTYNPEGNYQTGLNSVLLMDGIKNITSNNIDTVTIDTNMAGSRMLTIKGKNNYTGVRTIPVTVNPNIPSVVTVSLAENTAIRYPGSVFNGTYQYTGNEVKPQVVVTATVNGKDITIGEDDYTVTYTNNIFPYIDNGTGNEGKSSPKATVTLKRNYTGTGSVKFNIKGRVEEPEPVSYDLMNAVWEDSSLERPYTPQELDIHPVIRMSDGRVLAEGTDYSIRLELRPAFYQLGSIYAYAIGKGDYEGSLNQQYTIVPRTVNDVSVSVNSAAYTGSEVRPVPTLTLDGVTLDNFFMEANTVITYSNNIAVGTGTVTIQGTNLLTGTKTVEFEITGHPATPEDPDGPENPEGPDSETIKAVLVKAEKATAGTYVKGNTYTSSDKSVVTVDKKGKVTAKGKGTATVTVQDKAKKETTVYEYTVEVPSFEKKQYSVNKGESIQIVLKDTSLAPSYVLSNSMKKVIDITEDGIVTGKKKGSVTLTAQIHGKKYKTKIMVDAPELNITETSVNKGKKISLSLKNINSSSKKLVTWESSNPGVATVTAKGKVTTIAEGDAVITAVLNGKSISCNVHVDDPAFVEKVINMKVGETHPIAVTGVKEGVILKNESPKLITLAPDGTVTAIKKGTAKVSITVNKKKFTCQIKISK